MNNRNHREHEQRSKQYLDATSNGYFFDSESGIYKPTSEKPHTGSQQRAARGSQESPIFVHAWTDSRPAWMSYILSLLTLVVVGAYTYFTLGILEMNQTMATGSIQAAFEAARAAELAGETLDTQKKFFALEQRPYVVPEIKEGATIAIGKPIVVDIRLVNYGKMPALNLIVHRHLVFGDDGPPKIKPEPPDYDSQKGGILNAQDKGQITSAISLKDTYSNETAAIKPEELLDWDGSQPIFVFGRISYQDPTGIQYCTPYMFMYINASNWGDVTYFPTRKGDTKARKRSVSDLCPNIKSY